MKRWEYKYVERDGWESVAELLNVLGLDGWELVAAAAHEPNWDTRLATSFREFLLKRELL